jgi:hypothetical protein
MPAHRFAIGQSVHLRTRLGFSPHAAGSYRIIGLLPASENSPQYRIRSDAESHDRLAMEDDLDEIVSPAASGGTGPR